MTFYALKSFACEWRERETLKQTRTEWWGKEFLTTFGASISGGGESGATTLWKGGDGDGKRGRKKHETAEERNSMCFNQKRDTHTHFTFLLQCMSQGSRPSFSFFFPSLHTCFCSILWFVNHHKKGIFTHREWVERKEIEESQRRRKRGLKEEAKDEEKQKSGSSKDG